MNKWVVILGLLMSATFTMAQQSIYKFSNPVEQQRFEKLTEEFRCPKCQNQNLADSNAAIAVDLKNKTFELIEQGQTDTQIREYMIARYGYFISYKPPFIGQTIVLWGLPIIVFALGLIVVIVRRWWPVKLKVDQLMDGENQQINQLRQQYAHQVEQSSQPLSSMNQEDKSS